MRGGTNRYWAGGGSAETQDNVCTRKVDVVKAENVHTGTGDGAVSRNDRVENSRRAGVVDAAAARAVVVRRISRDGALVNRQGARIENAAAPATGVDDGMIIRQRALIQRQRAGVENGTAAGGTIDVIRNISRQRASVLGRRGEYCLAATQLPS